MFVRGTLRILIINQGIPLLKLLNFSKTDMSMLPCSIQLRAARASRLERLHRDSADEW